VSVFDFIYVILIFYMKARTAALRIHTGALIAMNTGSGKCIPAIEDNTPEIIGIANMKIKVLIINTP